MTGKLVSLEKFPGVRPVFIGGVYWRILAKIILSAGGSQAKEACKSINLCAGLEAGIYGDIHAVLERDKLGRVEMGEEQRAQIRQEEEYTYVEEEGGNLRTTAKDET